MNHVRAWKINFARQFWTYIPSEILSYVGLLHLCLEMKRAYDNCHTDMSSPVCFHFMDFARRMDENELWVPGLKVTLIGRDHVFLFFLFDASPFVYIVINNLISIVIHTTYYCLPINTTCFNPSLGHLQVVLPTLEYSHSWEYSKVGNTIWRWPSEGSKHVVLMCKQ